MKKLHFLLLLTAFIFGIACEKHSEDSQLHKHEKAIEKLLNQCKDFDDTKLSQNLVGKWKTDTEVRYDSEARDNLFSWCMVMGEYNIDIAGWGATTYEFTADGKGLYHVFVCYPFADDTPKPFEWSYDIESDMLTLSFNDGGNYQMKVIGFNGEYLAVDRTDHLYDWYVEKDIYYYMRMIFKRQTE
jgi:hypothetical protein